MPTRTSIRLTCLVAAALAVTAPAAVRGAALELPVPRITLYPGDVIAEDVLAMQKFAPAAERLPVAKTREALVGQVARRTLLPGKPIPLNAIRRADLVMQGKPVRVIFSSGGLTITSTAVALQSGGPGDTLNMRNAESGATIRGIVQADGTVRVEGQ